MRTRLAYALIVAATLTGCGNAQTDPHTAHTTTDAATVLKHLATAGLGLTAPAEQTPATDPGDLLGTPDGYRSRASADLPGGDPTADPHTIDRGLVIEVWPAPASADRRAQFVRHAIKEHPAALSPEYHYRTGDGTVLVRITGHVPPSLAGDVEQALSVL